MKSDIQPHARIREYLLGQSTSDNAALVEERLLTDDELYQEVLIVEDELIDQYVAGLLTESEKESFEKYFLAAPERREKLRFARNLKKYVSRTEVERTSPAGDANIAPEPKAAIATPSRAPRRFWPWSNPILSYSLAAAAVIVLAVAGVMLFRQLNAPVGGGKTLAVELVPGLSRGDERTKEIAVPADIAIVQLQLRIPNIPGYQTYRGLLQTNDAREISRQDNLPRDPASNDRITYQVPASLLKPGNYNLKLRGLNQQGEYEELARYWFRVINK